MFYLVQDRRICILAGQSERSFSDLNIKSDHLVITHYTPKTYVFSSQGFANYAAIIFLLLPTGQLLKGIGHTASKPWSFVQTFCMFVYVALRLSMAYVSDEHDDG